MNKIFNESSDKLLYSPMISIYPSRVNLHTEYIANIAKIFFQILNESNIEYYVFAGSSIGLLRNGSSIPWVDDYDIIIFENDLPKFDKIISILRKNLFIVRNVEKTIPTLKNIKKLNSNFKPLFNNFDGNSKIFAGYVIGSPRYNLNGYRTSFFQVDVFVSRNEYGKIKSIANWGLYHKKDVPITYVRPQRFVDFDGLKLPFFHNYEKDVELEYGNVLENSVIHICHGREKITIPKKWQDTYAEFDHYKNIAIQNTKKLLELDEYSNNINFEENISNNSNKNTNEKSNLNEININESNTNQSNIFDLFSFNNQKNNLTNEDTNININELLNNNQKLSDENELLDNDLHDEKHEDIIKSEKIDNLIMNNDNMDFFVDIEKNNYLDLMIYIGKCYNKVIDKTLHIFNLSNILYIYDIKYYFKDIKINLHINNYIVLENIRFFIDKIDIISVTDKNILENCEQYLDTLVIINKPIIKCDIENTINLIKNHDLVQENYYLSDKKEKPKNFRTNINKMINLKSINKPIDNNNKQANKAFLNNKMNNNTNNINNVNKNEITFNENKQINNDLNKEVINNNVKNINNVNKKEITFNENKQINNDLNKEVINNIVKKAKINTKFKSINSTKLKIIKIK
jgi:hypothetical protein